MLVGKITKVIKLVKNKAEAAKIANQYAPEHMELMTNDNQYYIDNISTAGAIFIGPYTLNLLGIIWQDLAMCFQHMGQQNFLLVCLYMIF